MKRWFTEFWRDDFKENLDLIEQLHLFVDKIQETPLGKQLSKLVHEEESGTTPHKFTTNQMQSKHHICLIVYVVYLVSCYCERLVFC